MLGVVVLNGPQVGLIVVACFGVLWASVGASVLRSPQRIGVIASAIIVALLLMMQSPRLHQHTSYFHPDCYVYSVVFEVLGILLAIIFIRRFADRSLIPPVVAIVVGLHFIGLCLATGQDVFIWLAIALCLCGALGVLASPAWRRPVTGFGSALALWASAINMILG